jgi:putative transposase
MIDPTAKPSFSRQAVVLGISRGSVHHRPRPRPRPLPAGGRKLMHRVGKLHMEFPFAGSRMLEGRLQLIRCDRPPTA